MIADPVNKQLLHFYRRILWGYPEASSAISIPEDGLISTGNYTFQVIHTPGHSPDHICLYEPERRWLFSGDLFVGGRDKILRGDYDILQIIESLKKISHLPIRVLFPAGARIRENPASELREKILYLEELGNRIVDLYHQGMSVKKITKNLLNGIRFIELFTLGHFSRKNLVLSYLGLKG